MLGTGSLPFFNFGKVAVGALQLFAPLPAVLVMRALRQLGALFGLSSQEFHRSHSLDSRIPGFCIAAFIILRCNENCVAPQQVSTSPGGGPPPVRRERKEATCPKSERATAQ